MKWITLFFVQLLSLNVFSQTNLSFKLTLSDSIKSIAWSDIDKLTRPFEQYFGNRFDDKVNVTYFRETVKLSFNSEEYSEIMTNYLKEGDSLKEVVKRRNIQRLRLIDDAMMDNRILFNLFDCFIYQFSIRYGKEPGLEIEYRIKADDDGMRIIGRKIFIVLASDY